MNELKVEPIVEQQTSKAVAAAEAINITDQATYEEAASALSKVKAVGKLISDKKAILVTPLNAALKEAREIYRPFETQQAQAEAIIKRKMVAWHDAVEADRRKKEEQLQRRQEKQTLKPETIVAKREELAQQAVIPASKEVYRKVRKVRVVDLKKVPAKYFIVDEVALRRDALALPGTGELIPGVEVYEETNLAR